MTTATAHALDWYPEPTEEPAESRVVLDGLEWSDYLRLLRLKGDAPAPRMAYLDGFLEIMSPGIAHEETKKTMARLLELYALLRGLDLYGLGSMTMRKGKRRGGVEPDECYVIGRERRATADLALEVAYTSWGVAKLEIYRRLKVREVWVWRGGEIAIHVLRGRAYEESTRSEVLPDLDMATFVRCLSLPNQLDAVRAWQAHLAGAASSV